MEGMGQIGIYNIYIYGNATKNPVQILYTDKMVFFLKE
jgi:hypothetical protein